MEMENKTYDWRNINAKANAGLTTGIVSLAGWLFGGGISNAFGGNCNGGGCSESQFVNRYEMSMQSQIAALQGLTKIVVPADNICPQPMPRYNSFVAPTSST